MSFDDPVAGSTKLISEERQQDILDARMLTLKAGEVVPVDGPGLTLLERGDRGGAPGVRKEEGELAEGLARPEHVEEHAVAVRSLEPGCKTAARDEVQRVGGIVPVEDHLAPRERPPARDREELAYVLVRKTLEQRPLHAPKSV